MFVRAACRHLHVERFNDPGLPPARDTQKARPFFGGGPSCFLPGEEKLWSLAFLGLLLRHRLRISLISLLVAAAPFVQAHPRTGI